MTPIPQHPPKSLLSNGFTTTKCPCRERVLEEITNLSDESPAPNQEILDESLKLRTPPPASFFKNSVGKFDPLAASHTCR